MKLPTITTHKLTMYVLISVLGILLSACDTHTAPPSPTMLGRLTLEISGIGGDMPSSQAYFSSDVSLDSQLLEDTNYLVSDFTSRVSSTFIYDNIRYITATFTFPNKSDVDREIFFVPIGDNTTVQNDGTLTPFRSIADYDENLITDNRVGLKIGEAKTFDRVILELVTSRYNSYVANIDTSNLTPNEDKGEVFFNEGFQAWNSDFSSRIIPANEDGRIMFSTSFSREINDQVVKDPFYFKLVFLVASTN